MRHKILAECENYFLLEDGQFKMKDPGIFIDPIYEMIHRMSFRDFIIQILAEYIKLKSDKYEQ